MGAGRVHLFGIRHHGPGSARSLELALDALDPASVLIEGLPEADAVLPFASSPQMRPPVALLAYAADEPKLALFYPFAEFSPEWRAILWAQRRGRPVRFIDLPAAWRLAEMRAARIREDRAAAEADQAAPQDAVPRAAPVRTDPLAHLASAAGYSDPEAWWNHLIEQGSHAPDLFAAIAQAMGAVRDSVEQASDRDDGETGHEARREAHMRLEIARESKAVDGAIAVVAGAWHVPALGRPAVASQDRALLKGLKSVKAAVTWIPWTEPRLAAASGYGAGVISPGWYRHLWRERERFSGAGETERRQIVSSWQGHVAAQLRSAGQLVATAAVIDAVRLAESLAAIRGLSMPGLVEMQDASLAALCQGETAPLRLVAERLIVGAEVGEVASDAPQAPLQADLTACQKRLRLAPEALEREIALDLRSAAGLDKSILLHRLLLLGIPWGRMLDAGGSRGTFRERWLLVWEPELSVRVAEAVVWGTTVEDAAAARAAARAHEVGSLPELAELVSACLLADLPDAARAVIDRIRSAAVASSDLGPLLRAVPPLANVLRYGTARRLPANELRTLVTMLVEQACAGFLYQCRQLDADAATQLRTTSAAFDAAIARLDDERLLADWQSALGRVTDDSAAAPMLQGFAVRRLYDRGYLPGEAAARYLSRALSPPVAPADAGGWLDGFLGEAAQLLLHDEQFLMLIDGFLTGLDEAEFLALLPMLRRSLGMLDAMERRRLLQSVSASERGGAMPMATAEDERGAAAFEQALPLLATILGLER